MLNYTRIPAPRVTIVDPQTGIVSNEWFRFFNNLYSIAYAATGSVTPGTYGSATAVPQITVDDFGAILNIVNVPIAIDANQIVSGTIASARISGSYTGITGVGTLTVGTWNATAITTAYGGTGLTSYTAGDTLYYASGTALTKLAIGASTFINTSSGTAPQWTNPSTITIGKATNLVGGAANRIAYQTAADTTGFIVAPTVSNTYLEWSGTAFQWSSNPLGSVTSVSVVSANGLAGTVATATTTPAITLSTTVTGLLKGNGTAISAASSGTDYAPATSGTSILYGNGAGGFSNVTIGTGVSFAAGTLSATGSGGTVTSVSGTGSVNGITLTGTVTSSGSLTLGGTLSGIGNSQLTNSTISGVSLGGNLFDLTAGTGVSFSVGTTYNGSAAITINATGTGGTVTSVAALTLGTAGTDLSSTVANSTTTPVITLNVPTASAANRGALSSTDWSTFNSKQDALVSGTNLKTVGGVSLLGSGDVGTIGVSYGGTGLTTLAAGRIPYGNGTSAFASSSGFIWDSANARLGITTSAPPLKLSILSVVTTANTSTPVIMIGSDRVDRYASIDSVRGGVSSVLGLAFSTSNGAAPAEVARIHASGGVSIGNTTDPGATNLSVTGTGKFGTTVGVGAATPSTSGAGITFPATQSASTDVNTLDDYEEGTWTPVVYGLTTAGVGTYSQQSGKYTKIGNVVTFTLTVRLTNHTGTGNMRISGLPFTAANDSMYPVNGVCAQSLTLTASNYLISRVLANSTLISLDQIPVGTTGAFGGVPIDTAFDLYLSGQYTV
jgi:hypothetical protein